MIDALIIKTYWVIPRPKQAAVWLGIKSPGLFWFFLHAHGQIRRHQACGHRHVKGPTTDCWWTLYFVFLCLYHLSLWIVTNFRFPAGESQVALCSQGVPPSVCLFSVTPWGNFFISSTQTCLWAGTSLRSSQFLLPFSATGGFAFCIPYYGHFQPSLPDSLALCPCALQACSVIHPCSHNRSCQPCIREESNIFPHLVASESIRHIPVYTE